MAAKRIPSQYPAFVVRAVKSFDDVDKVIRDITAGIEAFRIRLSDIIGDHADLLDGPQMPVKTDASRGAAGTAGLVIFNSDDGQLNIDDGTNWTLPDGTAT